MARSTNKQIIEEMVRKITKRFHPLKILLFGSYARGTQGPDSDVDLLIVMPVKGSKRKKTVEIYGLLAGMGLPKDIVVVTPEEFETYADVTGTIVRTARREGKVLYERAA